MPDPLLTLDAVTLLSPDGLPVFRELTWRLEPGARWHIHGDRGGGASAFLRLCCGIAEPQAGRIDLAGAELVAGSRHPFLERGALGYVPSDGGLVVNLSLQDNLALPLRFSQGLGRAAAAERARHWLDRAGLLALARQRPQVPGGALSWLAGLARAAAKGSQLWLVDRPAGGLDPRSLQAAEDLLTEAGRDPAVTMILVGGDWMAALGRELQLEDGQISAGRQP